MKFPYFKLPLKEKSPFFGISILRPIIPVELFANGKNLRCDALIDSGADFSILDADIGEYLGFNVRSGLKEGFGGIHDRGGAEAFFHKLEISVGGWRYKTIIGFSYDISHHGIGILGQKGFFDIFTIKFDLAKEEVELKERR